MLVTMLPLWRTIRVALALVAGACVLGLAHRWLYATTYRIYAEDQLPPLAPAEQRFEVEAGSVVSRLVVPDEARLRFGVSHRRGARLRVHVQGAAASRYRISV